MKNFKYKVLISIFVFIAVAVATVLLTRVSEDVKTTRHATMESASLPLVYMVSEQGQEFNLLHGYTNDVDQTKLHECITPLPSDRKLKVRIGTYGQTIRGVGYEIRSLDGGTFLEKTTASFSVVDSGSIGDAVGSMGAIVESVFNIKNLLEPNTEYMLKIIVETADNTASYYTRIVLGDGLNLDDKLAYTLYFSEVTYDDERINEIIPKLEPNSAGDNTNLGHVDIHSKLSQVGWGQLKPEIHGRKWPRVVEIKGNTADVLLEYQVKTAAVRGYDYYDVREFFRIRRADDVTTYLLGYDRYVDQIFDGIDDLNDSGRIYVGISSGLDEPELSSDSSGKVTCFVRRGELWSYNAKTNQFVQIFTFMEDGSAYDSVRESWDNHGIEVMNIDSNGNVDFVVYGYMNRGIHEGEMGISVCRYTAEDNSVVEILYVPRHNEIYESVAKDVETLVYLNEEGRFFICHGGTIYSIDTETKEYMMVADRVIDGSCLRSGSLFAYQEGDDEYRCSEIKFIRLETGETDSIEAANGKFIKTLGMIDGNIIYGMAYSGEIYRDEYGRMIFPMYSLEIIDREFNIVKTYQVSGIRVSGIETDDAKIVIKRLRKDAELGYVETDNDQLMSRQVSSGEELTTKYVATEVRQKELYIMLKASVPPAASSKIVYPKTVRYDRSGEMYLGELHYLNPPFRTYAMGRLCLMAKSQAAAISCADDWAGVVVDDRGSIVWDRYKPSSASVKLPENYEIEPFYEIIGASLDEALYYISKGYILRVRTGDDYLRVYSYDRNNATAYSESLGASKTYSRSELSTIAEASGNVIYVYKITERN